MKEAKLVTGLNTSFKAEVDVRCTNSECFNETKSAPQFASYVIELYLKGENGSLSFIAQTNPFLGTHVFFRPGLSRRSILKGTIEVSG